MPQTSPTRIFLVIRLDAEPDVVPENAHIVRAVSEDVLTKAPLLWEAAHRLIRREITFGEFKRLLRLA